MPLIESGKPLTLTFDQWNHITIEIPKDLKWIDGANIEVIEQFGAYMLSIDRTFATMGRSRRRFRVGFWDDIKDRLYPDWFRLFIGWIGDQDNQWAAKAFRALKINWYVVDVKDFYPTVKLPSGEEGKTIIFTHNE